VRDEIEALGDVLGAYGFSFFDLAEASPRAAKTKRCCARAVNWMLALAERVLTMRRTRSLPVTAIVKALEIARKVIERHRRYIIAATEILDGDYPHLAEYMDYIKFMFVGILEDKKDDLLKEFPIKDVGLEITSQTDSTLTIRDDKGEDLVFTRVKEE
jgi:hypothetical protein